MSTSDPTTVRFRHEFTVALPGEAAPLKAIADLRARDGAPQVDRVTFLRSGRTIISALPGTDLFKRALRELRGAEAGAIRKRAIELLTADADLALIAGW